MLFLNKVNTHLSIKLIAGYFISTSLNKLDELSINFNVLFVKG